MKTIIFWLAVLYYHVEIELDLRRGRRFLATMGIERDLPKRNRRQRRLAAQARAGQFVSRHILGNPYTVVCEITGKTYMLRNTWHPRQAAYGKKA
jgi:hypothetical protein